MFNKLYRHLEEINASLKKDDGSMQAAETREKMLGQLELLNTAIHSYENKVMLGQRRMVRLVAICAAVFIVCNTALILTQIQNHPASATIPGYPPSAATHPTADAIVQLQNAQVQENILKLDTLVAEQARSFRELKKLNTVAVATLRRIRNHFAELDKRATADTEISIQTSAPFSSQFKKRQHLLPKNIVQ